MVRYRREPTAKQRKLALAYMNGKKGKEAVLQAGYSETLAKSPSVLTRSRGFLLAMQLQAEELGYVSTALLNHLKIQIDDGALRDLNFQDTLKSLEKIANISDKYAEITGWKKKANADDGLEDIINIG